MPTLPPNPGYVTVKDKTRGTPAVAITAMTSSGHMTSSVTSPIDCAWPLSYRLPIVNNPLSPVGIVSEIFDPQNEHTRMRAHTTYTKLHPRTQHSCEVRNIQNKVQKSSRKNKVHKSSKKFERSFIAGVSPGLHLKTIQC